MTNDLESADELLNAKDYKMLNLLGVLRNVTKGLRRIGATLGGFGLFILPTKQLISRVNMLMQHYHASKNLGRKLDALLQSSTPIRYPSQSLYTRVCQVGTFGTIILGKNALAVVTTL